MPKKKKEKKEEFNIPVKIFGRKKEEEIQEKNEREIIPIMISKEAIRKHKAMEEEKKRESFDYEKMDLKNKADEKARVKKTAWAKRKNESERRKMMWVAIICFMVVIIFVWAIFLKYNILLENLSVKQMQRDEEWAKIKDEFEQSYQDFETMVEKSNKMADIKIDAQISTSTEAEFGTKKNKTGINKEDIEKLKEKIIKKK